MTETQNTNAAMLLLLMVMGTLLVLAMWFAHVDYLVRYPGP